MRRETPTRPVAAQARVRRGYFECRYGQLHVHNSIPPGGGFEEAAPLLCLHDCPGSGRVFARFLALAGRDRSVYAPDVPGFGESDPPPGVAAIEDYAAAIGDFLDSMRLRRLDILGQRVGALIGTELAVTRPRQIGRLVMVSAPLLTAEERRAGARAPPPPPPGGGAPPARGRAGGARAAGAPGPPPGRPRAPPQPPALPWSARPLPGTRAGGPPPPPGPAEARHGDSAVQTLTVRLRETQGLLTGKDERLRQIEHARDEALEARAVAERRAAQLDHELAQLKAEHAFQLDEHARARAHFEEQLAQARALVSAAGARAHDLQRPLAGPESAARLPRDQDPKHQQRPPPGRARPPGAMDDLREERERVLGLIESLQSAESRRGILEELVGDLQREGEERERELARVARAVVGRDARTRELEAELAQSASP